MLLLNFIMLQLLFISTHIILADTTAVKSESVSNIIDARVKLVKDDHAVISQFVRSLFTLLYEVTLEAYKQDL